MEKCCFVGYAESLCKLGSTLDVVMRKFLAHIQDVAPGANPESLHHIVYMDFSKLGRVSTVEVNEAIAFAKRILELNPLKSILFMIPPSWRLLACLA